MVHSPPVRRLARRLVALCSAVSLLLCVAVGVLWVWSYWRFVDFGRYDHRRDAAAYTQSLIRLGSTDGTLLFTWRDVVWPWSLTDAATVSVIWPRQQRGWFWTLQADQPDLTKGAAKRPGDGGWEISILGSRARSIGRQPGREPGVHGYVVMVPHAIVCAALAVLPAVSVLRWRRRRRRLLSGLCPSCGYDLRASPGRCPECGAAAVQA